MGLLPLLEEKLDIIENPSAHPEILEHTLKEVQKILLHSIAEANQLLTSLNH